MPDTATMSVLARKAAAGRARAPRHAVSVDHGQTPARALVRAIKRAGMPYPGLEAEPRDETVAWDQSLAAVTDALPEGGLLVILEGADRLRGILHLHQGFLDALIEVQTTGAVDSVEGQVRPATQIDAALSRDFIDMMLSSLETELEEQGFGDLLV
ncbi:hypothetical protein HKCCE3408_16255 [Rhodobacterales bacterium HKCCE3408]|nr:hypothetical protein [Rhodobacterales bacterium HKCCE3408]